MKTLKLIGGRIILTKYDSSAKFPWPKNPQLTVTDEDGGYNFVTLNKTDVKQLINALTEVLQSFPSEKTNTH